MANIKENKQKGNHGGKRDGAGQKNKGRKYITLYLDTKVVDALKSIKATSNDLLNQKLTEFLKLQGYDIQPGKTGNPSDAKL